MAEPAALSEAEIMADQFGDKERGFEINSIIAGRDCRDALKRVCLWHKERGMKDVDCNRQMPSP